MSEERGMRYFIVSKNARTGAEYIHHGGYVHKWDCHPYYLHGYTKKWSAQAQLTRLQKLYDGFVENYSDQNKEVFRIVELEF